MGSLSQRLPPRISLAIDGRITRRMDAASLLAKLEELMEPEMDDAGDVGPGGRGSAGEDAARGDGK